MKKSRKSETVAGEQNSYLGFRLSADLRTRFTDACAVGIPRNAAKVIRPFLEDYAEFAKANNKQPMDLHELYRWVLARDA